MSQHDRGQVWVFRVTVAADSYLLQTQNCAVIQIRLFVIRLGSRTQSIHQIKAAFNCESGDEVPRAMFAFVFQCLYGFQSLRLAKHALFDVGQTM